jgi:hypothetical protein
MSDQLVRWLKLLLEMHGSHVKSPASKHVKPETVADATQATAHFSLIFCDVNCDSDGGGGLRDVNLLDWNLTWKTMQ